MLSLSIRVAPLAPEACFMLSSIMCFDNRTGSIHSNRPFSRFHSTRVALDSSASGDDLCAQPAVQILCRDLFRACRARYHKNQFDRDRHTVENGLIHRPFRGRARWKIRREHPPIIRFMI